MNTSSKLNQFEGDALDDLLGERTGAPRALVVPPANYQPKDFSEPCAKCSGTGRFRGWSGRSFGQCFACKGAGKKTFKTSRDDRQKARTSAIMRKVNAEAKAVEEFKAEHPAVWSWMDGSTFPFAVTLQAKLRQYGSLTDGQLDAAYKCVDKLAAAKEATKARIENAPVADAAGVDRLKTAFDKAIAYAAAKGKGIHLRSPKITIGEMVIKPAKANSANPGALYVNMGAQYLGKIVDGRFRASRECSPEQSAKVLAFIAAPSGAAKAYGQETGVCCVCNASLKSEWRLRGIGPVCAEKYGW